MKGLTFRIYTEDVRREELINLTSLKFEAFTTYEGVGFWRGLEEKSLIIEVLATEDFELVEKNIQDLAFEIKSLNKQEAVLVQKLENNSFLL
jgi:hypothetical protein